METIFSSCNELEQASL